VWSSAEPFGWATDHYGRWFKDEFQGWVWQPGLEWGPAWVDWSIAGDYVGWRPLGAGIRGGLSGDDGTSWAPARQLGATDLRLHVKHSGELGPVLEQAKAVDNTVTRGGAIVNLGPSISGIERAAGRPLPRARVEDLVQRGGVDDAASVEATRQAAERAAREVKALTVSGAPAPPRVPVVRPVTASPPPAERRTKKAAADTTRR
jgi:hypothetical protein